MRGDNPGKTDAADDNARSDQTAKRAKPITNWLAFVRPYMHDYDALPFGERAAFIRSLSEKTGTRENTLRRFFAAAKFLEAAGVTALPDNGRKRPVGSVEAIARVWKIRPEWGKELLNYFLAGKGAIRDYKTVLAGLRQSLNWYPNGVLPFSLPPPDVETSPRAPYPNVETSPRAGLVRTNTLNDVCQYIDHCLHWNCAPWHISFVPFKEVHGVPPLFDATAAPVLFAIGPRDARVPIFDDRHLSWAASVPRTRREFIRNVIIAAAVYPLVLVYAELLYTELERGLGSVRPDIRRCIHFLEGQLTMRLRP